MLERRAVPVAHQEADQALVALGHLLGGDVERHACAVDDREVRGEARRRARGSRGRAPRSCSRRSCRSPGRSSRSRPPSLRPPPDARTPVTSGDSIRVGTSGWSYPSWRPGFYPGGDAAGGVPALLRHSLRHRRAEHDGLPAPRRGSVQALGRCGAGRLLLRAEARADGGSTRSASSSSGSVRSATGSGRSASPFRTRATRGCSPTCSARSIPRSSSRSTSVTSPGPGVEGVVAVNDFDAGAVPLHPPARASLLRRRPARAGGQASPAGVRLLPPRGRADRAGLRRAAARALSSARAAPA